MNALLQSLGGVGLFLLGMALMTSGLRKVAGERLRSWLAHSTRNPAMGVVTGATVTALIQSSSATTVAAIGFVGAGLMSFTQALGVIFGANIGTTITGWMVALIGFKLKLSAVALPLLFGASLIYLLRPSRMMRGVGKALSGFCLIFIGISFLQQGLSQYQEVFSFEGWNADRVGGRFLLLFLGIALTLITQSSSATVAMAITALNTSLIDLPQAAAVIIGADIGTTGTAALATIGGTTASRRTGFAHVIYNFMTGVCAFFLLPFYLWAFEAIQPGAVSAAPELVAVSFHSFFNTIGVLLVLPLTSQFGRLIERMFPEETPMLSAPFDERLLEDSYAALAGLEAGGTRLAVAALDATCHRLTPQNETRAPSTLPEIVSAVETARRFAVGIGGEDFSEGDADLKRLFAGLHLLDHIERLVDRSRDEALAKVALDSEGLARSAEEVRRRLEDLAREMESSEPKGAVEALERFSNQLEEDKANFRETTMRRAAEGGLSGEEMNQLLDARRWLRRVAYHSWRMAHYWKQSLEPSAG